jgi:hypothetical protein
MPTDARRGVPALNHLLPMMVAGCLLVAAASAQVSSLYYREVPRGGTVYVFNTAGRYHSFVASGEMGPAITVTGRGPRGETIVAENQTALDLYLFKHDLPAYERSASPATPTPTAEFPRVRIGSTGFLSYQSGKSAGADYSKFIVKRAYLNVTAQINPYLAARITPDVAQDATTGETKVRMKFVYATFSLPSLGFITKPCVSFGMVPTPWFDFENRVNLYRMQDQLFFDRVGLLSTADLGLAVGGLFGGEMPDEFRKTVSSAFPGRYGSFAVGLFNGGGYTASEQNGNKALEGRVSIRPLPDAAPGLQLSYTGVAGKGNTLAEPEWTLSSVAVSFQSIWANMEAILLRGRGNAAGNANDAHGTALDRDGWSGFVEAKPCKRWSVIARYDAFTPDRTKPAIQTRRTIAGIAYHLGNSNDVLVDYDTLRYTHSTKPDDKRAQLTLQYNF